MKTNKREVFYLGSRPLEDVEADKQWFLVGVAGSGLVGDESFAAFQSEEAAFEYIWMVNGACD